MRILIASDKFKGSLTGAEACGEIRGGLLAGLRDDSEINEVEVSCALLVDGGEGMARAITDARNGEWAEVEVNDPRGRPVLAGYGWIESEKLAVIEMAEASGLWRIGEAERDPWRASTYGTGELIRHAIARGAEKILLGIGGSATNDGGCGMARAIGFRFLGSDGRELTDLPADLGEAVSIERPAEVEFPAVEVACDVDNPLLGPDGCTRIYGPQKNVNPDDFEKHENRLRHLAVLTGESGSQLAEVPGAGAAGGLGFGSLVFLGAKLRSGFDLVAETLGLTDAVKAADVVITGEGKLDRQTLRGKGPAGLAAMARRHGKPVVVFAGKIEPGAEEDLADHFDRIFGINTAGLPESESMARAAELLRTAVAAHAEDICSLARAEES